MYYHEQNRGVCAVFVETEGEMCYNAGRMECETG